MDITRAKMFVRSLNNSSAKIFIAFILARTALDVQEIREWTGLKRETIYDGLDTLRVLNMIEKQVLEHGRIVWLPAGDLLPGFLQMSEKRTPELLEASQMSEKRTSDPSESFQMSGKRIGTLVEEDSINLIPNTDSSTPTEQMSEKRTSGNSENNANLPSTLEILKHTDLLFDGSIVMSHGIETREPLDALRWCAYAYTQKSKIRGAAGIVRNQLKENNRAPEWTKHRWDTTLPQDFLIALGLATPLVSSTEEDAEAESTVLSLAAGQPDPSINERLHDGETMSPAQAWQSVLGQLQVEMPRATFDTWVRDAQAIRYDGNTLYVGVVNAYTRDWWESRLESTVRRLLIGILNEGEIQVQFVTLNEVPA